MPRVLEALFNDWAVGFGVPILVGLGITLLTDEFKDYKAARWCFWVSALWSWGKVLMWSKDSQETFSIRAVVVFIACGVVGVVLMFLLQLTNKRESPVESQNSLASAPEPLTQQQEHHGASNLKLKVNRPVTAMPPSAESVIFTKPPPGEIRNQIDALPSFQQKGAADAYRGLKVFWPATFEAVEKASESNQWLVILHDDKDNTIVCNGIDVETDPRLKLARRGDVVNVHGTIQSVLEIAVVLKDVSIDFK